MGILSRFKDIMAADLNAVLDRNEDLNQLNRIRRDLDRDLSTVTSEKAAVLAHESRAKRAWDDCRAEIDKLQRYAEKAVEAGDDERARKFLARKVPLAPQEVRLRAAYEAAGSDVAAMEQMYDKLAADIGRVEERLAGLQRTWRAARTQRQLNDLNVDDLEEKVNDAYNEATALAELRAGAGDDLDASFEALERRAPSSAEDELAAIKQRLNKKE